MKCVRLCSLVSLMTLLLGLSLGSQAIAFAGEALVYISPWAGTDAEKERRIVGWAAEQAGVQVDLQYPGGGVRGVIEQLLLYRATGIPVDIVWNHQSMHHQFDRLGAWIDLRPFVERDSLVELDMFAPGALQFFTSPDGRITALPFRWSFTVLNYNIDHFEEAGLAFPDESWTYEEEFLDASKRLTRIDAQGTPLQWGVAPLRLHEFIWRAWGAQLLTPDKRASGFTDPAAFEALQFLRDLYVEHGVATSSLKTWSQGKTSMLFEHPALERHDGTLRWDIAQVPLGPSGERTTRGAVGAWSIPSWSRNPDAAWQVVRLLASKEGQIRYLEEGLGGTRFDSIREFMIDNFNPSKFEPPLHPDAFQNREVYLEAMQYAVIDTERQLLAEYVPELGFGGGTPLGHSGDITRPDRPVSHIIDELVTKVNLALRDHPDLFSY